MLSDSYKAQLVDLHRQEVGFGGGSRAEIVAQVVRKLDVVSVSDYGAGKKELERRLKVEFGIQVQYLPYDPAFPEYGPAMSADLVCCIEVLEHIEPEYLGSVLKDLAHLVRKYGFFTIHCGPSSKMLPDGRNAHLIQQPISWWLPQISEFFEVQYLSKTSESGFAILVIPKDAPQLASDTVDFHVSPSVRRQFATLLHYLRVSIGRKYRARLRRVS